MSGDRRRIPGMVRNHSLAVCAFVRVSCVVNVFDAIMKSVVSGFRCFSVSAICVPSTFDTKCTGDPDGHTV